MRPTYSPWGRFSSPQPYHVNHTSCGRESPSAFLQALVQNRCTQPTETKRSSHEEKSRRKFRGSENAPSTLGGGVRQCLVRQCRLWRSQAKAGDPTRAVGALVYTDESLKDKQSIGLSRFGPFIGVCRRALEKWSRIVGGPPFNILLSE